ncbi:MAG: rhodanese-like domain-containing protein [Deinococcus sp.]|nr:rhodanese-like domain-containing protein [Deinococcus sp.]
MRKVADVGITEALSLRKQGVLFVDVREADEHAMSRIPGSVLIPLSELAARYTEIPRDRQVVLYCRSGNRSWNAAAWLQNKGYDKVVNLAGGIIDWARSGLEIEPR